MADALDLLTLDEAKRSINYSTSAVQDDDLLARHITAVSRVMDEMCGPVVQRTVTAERHDGGTPHIVLRRRPIVSITQVRESRNGTIAVIPQGAFGDTNDSYDASRYEQDPTLLSGDLVRTLGGFQYVWWPGVSNIEATYVAGRFASTDLVDARFKDCAGAVLRRYWKRESASWAQSADFWNQETHEMQPGFFKVAQPVIAELLFDEVQAHPDGFA